MSRCTKAILYKENLRHNLEEIRKNVSPDTKICIAVKADGYGHNAVLTAKLAQEVGGIEYFAVATVDEGVELRKAGIISTIILLSLSIPEDFDRLFEFKISPLIFGEEYISLLAKYADEYYKNTKEKLSVHLAVDTGMGRIGCYPQEVLSQAKLINSKSHLELKGLTTHFCVGDSIKEEDQAFTQKQFEEFTYAINTLKENGINPGICSCGNSAIVLNNKDMHLDMVRPGIITYGYYPDEITKDYLKSKNIDFDLKPVLALETQVVAIRDFPANKSISYGRTYLCPQDTKIAILPIGYADGLLRRFSPGIKVCIKGKEYPVVGRICMDQCMVDLGKDNNDVALWDKVIIFGPKESGALQTADDLARIGNTISYEVLTSLSKRVKRIIE